MAKAGASVAIWSRRAERNAQAVADLEGLGAAAVGVRCDVAMEETLDRFGRLDRLVANAGRPASSRSRTCRCRSGMGAALVE